METKANPNPNGCLARALPDEPFFVLLARDPVARKAIEFWAEQRAQRGVDTEDPQSAEQLVEAFEVAEAMEAWRVDNDGAWRGLKPEMGPLQIADSMEALMVSLLGPPIPDDDSPEANAAFAHKMGALVDVVARVLVGETTHLEHLAGSVSIFARQLGESVGLRRRLLMLTVGNA